MESSSVKKGLWCDIILIFRQKSGRIRYQDQGLCFTPFYTVLSRQKHSRGWVDGSGYEALVLLAEDQSLLLRTLVKNVEWSGTHL